MPRGDIWTIEEDELLRQVYDKSARIIHAGLKSFNVPKLERKWEVTLC